MRCFASVAVFFCCRYCFSEGLYEKRIFYGIDVLSSFAPCLSSAYTPPPRIAEHSGKFPACQLLLQGWPCPFSLCRRAFGFQKVQIGQNFGFFSHMEIRQKNTLALSFWSAVYFPFTAARIYRNRGTGAALSIFLDWLKNMVFRRGTVFVVSPATAAAVLAVGFCLKRVSINAVLAIGFCLYLVGLCGQSYFGLVRQIPHSPELSAAVKSVYDFIGTTRNGIFEGFVFIALGAKLFKRELRNLKKSAAGLALSLILLCGEFALVSKMRWRLEFDMYLMLLPCAWFMLKTALCFRPFAGKAAAPLPPVQLAYIFHPHALHRRLLPFHPGRVYRFAFLMFAIGLLPALLVSTAVILLSGKKHFFVLKKNLLKETFCMSTHSKKIKFNLISVVLCQAVTIAIGFLLRRGYTLKISVRRSTACCPP